MAIDNFPLWHASLCHPPGNIPLAEGEPCITMYKCAFFCTTVSFSLPAAGLFSYSRLRGTQGPRPYTTAP